jgi:hypothetical protein
MTGDGPKSEVKVRARSGPGASILTAGPFFKGAFLAPESRGPPGVMTTLSSRHHGMYIYGVDW